jgi:hypothetical protein
LDEAAAIAQMLTGLAGDHAPDRPDPWLQQAGDSAVRQQRRFAQHLSATRLPT